MTEKNLRVRIEAQSLPEAAALVQVPCNTPHNHCKSGLLEALSIPLLVQHLHRKKATFHFLENFGQFLPPRLERSKLGLLGFEGLVQDFCSENHLKIRQ